MINISGHLREERKITGYYNQDVPLIVNCCGKQVFQTQDYFCNRKNGRLDYQIIYIHRGSGHFYLNNEWITLSAGNIVFIVQAYHSIIPIMQRKNLRSTGYILLVMNVKIY